MEQKDCLVGLASYMKELATQLGETSRRTNSWSGCLATRLVEAEKLYKEIALAQIQAQLEQQQRGNRGDVRNAD